MKLLIAVPPCQPHSYCDNGGMSDQQFFMFSLLSFFALIPVSFVSLFISYCSYRVVVLFLILFFHCLFVKAMPFLQYHVDYKSFPHAPLYICTQHVIQMIYYSKYNHTSYYMHYEYSQGDQKVSSIKLKQQEQPLHDVNRLSLMKTHIIKHY